MASVPSALDDDRGAALHPVGRQDGHLGLVDDRRRQEGAEGPGVGDRERPARDVVGAQLLRPGPVGQLVDATGHAPQRQLLGVLHDGHDESLVVEVDGEAQVELMVHDQRVVADRGVEMRPLVQRLDRGPGHEGQVGEREALLGPELRRRGPGAPARPARSRLRAPRGCGRMVAFDRTMCSAVRRRMLVKGMISSVPAVGGADADGRGAARGRVMRRARRGRPVRAAGAPGAASRTRGGRTPARRLSMKRARPTA